MESPPNSCFVVLWTWTDMVGNRPRRECSWLNLQRSSGKVAVNTWRRYRPKFGNTFFDSRCICTCRFLQRVSIACYAERCISYQWWANHKSNHKSKSQIIGNNDLNQNLKSKIKSQIIKSNPNHFRSKSNPITPKCHFFENVQFT